MTAPPALIVLDQIGKTYDGAPVLTGASLSIDRGQFVALVGGSGAGKTTLLKTINALIVPTTGRVLIDGQDVAEQPGPALRRRVGYVFQEVGLFPHMTVAQNIGITPSLLDWPADRIAARVATLLDLVALPREVAPRLPAELSGGQRQRVGVARALAAEPSILLMDEPFGALDPVTRVALAQDVRRLHDALNLTTVMVTHDVGEALLTADRIVVMAAGPQGGEIVADATPTALLAGAHADSRVTALIDAPRRQAEKLANLAQKGGARG
ncbi:ATP-binding cassette domain-containing protein [Caulobacter sp. DWR1-3-2b1]|uniref:ATP-binding cassette domain-containing protein n=1 Tax=Caulobacter sp. DWR1-3-2b1 TaxID=2804670 RepID=UPI003CEAEA77